jgi:hypothetical protein
MDIEVQLPLTFLMDGSECYAASRIGKELDWNMPGVEMDFNLFNGSLRQTVHDKDSNGWSDPGGKGFMVRSRTYDQDSLKISGGEPLLKLVAVDWFKSEQKIGHIAKQPDCCVQSEAGRKAPFILVINLQVLLISDPACSDDCQMSKG